MPTTSAAIDWSLTSRIMVACGLLILAVIVLGIGLTIVRRRLRDASTPGPGGQPWTLDDVERMRERGDLTESEYRAMRATLVAAYRGDSPPPSRPAPPVSVRPPRQDDDGGEWEWTSEDFDLKKPPEG